MSKTFKTPKGTDLPILNLRGKDYLQVAHRLVWFREECPEWSIETEIVSSSDNACLFRAFIKDASGKIIATAHKQEDVQGFKDFIEKAETGAVGRALAMCGYGTQFAPEILEETDVVDAPIEPKKTNKKQSEPTPPSDPTGITDAQRKKLFATARDHGWDDERIKKFMKARFEVDSTKKLTQFTFQILLGAIEQSPPVK